MNNKLELVINLRQSLARLIQQTIDLGYGDIIDLIKPYENELYRIQCTIEDDAFVNGKT